LVNEIYAKGSIAVHQDSEATLSDEMYDIEQKLLNLLDQEDAQVKVQRWFPGVLSEIVEEVVNVDPTVSHSLSVSSVSENIAKEAAGILERKRQLQTTATTKKTVDEILNSSNTHSIVGGPPTTASEKRRTKRVKMRSTPALGGNMFGDGGGESSNITSLTGGTTASSRVSSKKSPYKRVSKTNSFSRSTATHVAEVMVGRESFNVQISGSTLARLRKSEGYSMLNDTDLQESGNSSQMEHALSGYVRVPLSRIEELPVSERGGHSMIEEGDEEESATSA